MFLTELPALVLQHWVMFYLGAGVTAFCFIPLVSEWDSLGSTFFRSLIWPITLSISLFIDLKDEALVLLLFCALGGCASAYVYHETTTSLEDDLTRAKALLVEAEREAEEGYTQALTKAQKVKEAQERRAQEHRAQEIKEAKEKYVQALVRIQERRAEEIKGDQIKVELTKFQAELAQLKAKEIKPTKRSTAQTSNTSTQGEEADLSLMEILMGIFGLLSLLLGILKILDDFPIVGEVVGMVMILAIFLVVIVAVITFCMDSLGLMDMRAR